jgi:hypothetical protein
MQVFRLQHHGLLTARNAKHERPVGVFPGELGHSADSPVIEPEPFCGGLHLRPADEWPLRSRGQENVEQESGRFQGCGFGKIHAVSQVGLLLTE